MVGPASEVAAASDTVLLTAWSRRPLLGLAETRPGRRFTTLGVDEPGEHELAADLLETSFPVVDDHGPAATAGVLAGADASTRITADASLGELLLPWQDLAVAWLAYRQAELNDVGNRVDPLA